MMFKYICDKVGISLPLGEKTSVMAYAVGKITKFNQGGTDLFSLSN